MLATPFLRTTRALTLSVTTLVFARTIMEALTQAVTPENIPQ